MIKDTKALGNLGENFATAILFEEGYSILETKYTCRAGEVDIVAAKDGEICFVEVKTRQTDEFGRPAESVTKRKQRRIKAAATCYLQQKHLEEKYVTFQVMEVYINQIENAF